MKSVGDDFHHVLTSDDDPPKGNETMPKCDAIDKPKLHNVDMKELKEELRKGFEYRRQYSLNQKKMQWH